MSDHILREKKNVSKNLADSWLQKTWDTPNFAYIEIIMVEGNKGWSISETHQAICTDYGLVGV